MHPIHRRGILGTGAAGASRNADTVAVRNVMAGDGQRIDPRARNDRRAARERGENTFFFDGEGELVEEQVVREPNFAPARWDSAQPAIFSAFDTPWSTKIEFETSRELVLVAYLNTPEDDPGTSEGGMVNVGNSPFAVDPFIVPATGTLLGGVVGLGKLVYGHGGISRTQYFTLNNGQATKLPFVGSSAQFGPALVPWFYNADDTAVPRVYTIGLGGPPLDSERFSNPDQRDLQAVLAGVPGQANCLANSATCLAYLARGQSASSSGTAPKAARKFFGFLHVGAPFPAEGTKCPIQWGCDYVQLVGPSTLQFFQVNNSLPGNPILDLGPFPPGVAIPIDNNAGAILVGSTVPIVAHEQYFELHYYPGF